jgi:hypothetical protein
MIRWNGPRLISAGFRIHSHPSLNYLGLCKYYTEHSPILDYSLLKGIHVDKPKVEWQVKVAVHTGEMEITTYIQKCIQNLQGVWNAR